MDQRQAEFQAAMMRLNTEIQTSLSLHSKILMLEKELADLKKDAGKMTSNTVPRTASVPE